MSKIKIKDKKFNYSITIQVSSKSNHDLDTILEISSLNEFIPEDAMMTEILIKRIPELN